MDCIVGYFAAERAESLLFIAGMAGPLVVIAAIQFIVGGTVFLRSPHDTARVQQAVQTDRAQIASAEIPRMRTVIDNFVAYRWIELALLALGIALLLAARRSAFARGAGLGLALQSAIMHPVRLVAPQVGLHQRVGDQLRVGGGQAGARLDAGCEIGERFGVDAHGRVHDPSPTRKSKSQPCGACNTERRYNAA